MSGRTAARSALAGERLLPIVLAVAALGGLVVTLSAWIPHLRVLRSERVDEVEGLHPGLVLADSLYLADVWEVGGGLQCPAGGHVPARRISRRSANHL